MADAHEVFDLVTEALYQSADFGLFSRSRQQKEFTRTVANSLAVVQSIVPDTAPGDLSFPTPIIDYCPEHERFGRFIEQLLAPFTYQDTIFKTLLNTLERNLYHASGFDWPPNSEQAQRYTNRLVSPSQYRARDKYEIAEAYLRDTPLLWLFQAEVPFSIDQRDRYEGHWVVAHPGAGKTQALSYLIEHDLALVARGQASLIVMDSQGNTPGYGDKPPTLLYTLSHLEMFAPGGALDGKLVYIDPADDPGIPFNIFDLGLGGTLEQKYAASGQLLSFVLTGLISDTFTPPMEILFSNCLELLLSIPGATLDHFMRLLEPDGADHFKAEIERLPDPHLRSYFTNHFKRAADVTKQAVLMRLMGLRRFPAFKRLISHPKTEFNLSAELERGKVIVFDTNEGELGKVGTAVPGRFVLALIAAVGRNRVLLPESRKLPVFVHIDELGNYCASGASQLNDILSLVRWFPGESR